MAGKNPTGQYQGGFHFRVTISGINEPMDGFLKISEVTSETEQMTFKHGMDRVVRKAAGRTSFGDITLERVYSGLDEFSAWRDRIVNGEDDRRTVSIEFLRPDGATVVRRYECYNAYPSKWALPAMDAGSSNPAIEKITIAVERVVQFA